MRVVFLGTPQFAVPALKALLASHFDVCAVITQPDRPANRGHELRPPPVKVVALQSGIPVHQPEKIRSENLQPLFQSLHYDFIVVVAYGQILPGWLLDSARIAPINIHGSLLPKYRGAAPVIWSIVNGDTVTGVTTMLMDEQLDTGAILLQREVRVSPHMTAGDLSELLSEAGADLLVPTLEGFSSGAIKAVPQDGSAATWAPRVTKEQARIDWGRSASELHNRIRAFNPWPLAFTYRGEERLQLIQSAPDSENVSSGPNPGTLLGLRGDSMLIACGGGSALEIQAVKPANRRIMSGREYAGGSQLRPGNIIFQKFIPQAERIR